MARIQPINLLLQFATVIFATFLGLVFSIVRQPARDPLTCVDFSTETSSISRSSRDPYHLFGTATAYSNAQPELERLLGYPPWPSELLPGTDHRCKPAGYLFLLSRHANRYPSKLEIRKLRKFLNSFRRELLVNMKDGSRLKNDLIAWQLKMADDDDQRVSQSGVIESKQFAKQWSHIYPKMFAIKSNKTIFEIGVTLKDRTTETAKAFIDGLFKLQMKKAPKQLKSQIKKNKFPLKKLDFLWSHTKCHKMQRLPKKPKKLLSIPQIANLVRSIPFSKYLLASFSKRHHLPEVISFDSFQLLYLTCKSEMSLEYFSVWCQLFTDGELQIMEYISDLYDYHTAHEVPASTQLGCVVIKELYQQLRLFVNLKKRSSSVAGKGGGGGPKGQRQTKLYFSHENLLSKLFSFLKTFDKFPRDSIILTNGSTICIPAGRHWRSSLMLPYLTNFAAVLYQCEQGSSVYSSNQDSSNSKTCPVSLSSKLSSISSSPDSGTNESNSSSEDDDDDDDDNDDKINPNLKYRIFTMVNEVPVALGGTNCPEPLCDLDKFFHQYASVLSGWCNLDEMCKPVDSHSSTIDNNSSGSTDGGGTSCPFTG